MKRWELHTGDCMAWLKTLPKDHVDLVFTSPPYLAARTYGIGADIPCEEKWTAWMVEVVTELSRVCKGLVAVNCEGQTRNYRYLPAPFLLAADLHRKGFNLRRPAYFYRVGIPGSGGPDWLRGDVEPIICVSRPGKFSWSDNTACGHPPKWAPGGEMYHRVSDGTRTNQWGKTGAKTGTTWDGKREKIGNGKTRPSHRVMTRERPGTHSQKSTVYKVPVLANPGNLIMCNVGGGQMGSSLAHKNEAPFPKKLAEFFVKSFCPPDGLVMDPFCGSGTTGHAAVEHGRRFIGCDIRMSQTRLTETRLDQVTPCMFVSG